MKKIYSILLGTMLLGMASCELDNYDEPGSFLTGRITYNGEAIQTRSDEVRFQLWQNGYPLKGNLDVAIDQDGTFNGRFFDGSYKLVFPKGQGPFKTIIQNPQRLDTLDISIKGNTNLDIEVLPYYMIRNAQFSHAGATVKASCSIEKIITGVDAKDIERVGLYVNNTAWVSSDDQEWIDRVDNVDFSNLNAINIEVAVSGKYANSDYVYARIGVKIKDVEDEIYSSVTKVSLK
jgi:hypothetical protein